MHCQTGSRAAFQKLIGQSGICLKSRFKRGERAIHHDNMHHSARCGPRGRTRIFHELAKAVLPNLGLDPMPEGHTDLACVLQHAPNPLRREGHVRPHDTL